MPSMPLQLIGEMRPGGFPPNWGKTAMSFESCRMPRKEGIIAKKASLNGGSWLGLGVIFSGTPRTQCVSGSMPCSAG